MSKLVHIPSPPILFLLFGAMLYLSVGWVSAVVGVLGAWFLYRLFWGFRYGATKLSWEHAADELGLEFVRHDDGVFGTESDEFGSSLRFLLPTQPEFELRGEFGDREVRVRIDIDGTEVETIWSIECGDLLPEWFQLRPSGVSARADRWLDVEDVKVGHSELDKRALLAGRDADSVREFVWDHDLADELAELLDETGPFEVSSGEVRVRHDGIARRSRPLRQRLERLRTVADRLDWAIGRSSEETEPVERSEPVYEYE